MLLSLRKGCIQFFKYGLLLLSLFVLMPQLSAEDAAPTKRRLTVIPSIDSTGMNIAQPLQQAIGQLAYQSGRFQVQFSSFQLTGFSEAELAQTFARLDTDLVVFAYVEINRLSLFIFNVERPKEYIPVSIPMQPLNQSAGQAYQIVQYNLQLSFEQGLYFLNQGQYQPLPGLSQEDVGTAEDGTSDSITKRLFLEFAQFHSSNLYFGANFGMARFEGMNTSYAMTDFGAYLGYRMGSVLAAEVGVDAFSYLIGSFTTRYYLPILPEKYVNLSLSLGASMVLSKLHDIYGVDQNALTVGGLMFGPGIGIDIPLLGARVRGEVRFLLGSGSVLFGSYGLTYIL